MGCPLAKFGHLLQQRLQLPLNKIGSSQWNPEDPNSLARSGQVDLCELLESRERIKRLGACDNSLCFVQRQPNGWKSSFQLTGKLLECLQFGQEGAIVMISKRPSEGLALKTLRQGPDDAVESQSKEQRAERSTLSDP
jgi:hypothetical protein